MRLRSIEALRGFAALSVVFTHASSLIPVIAGLNLPSFHNGLQFHGQPGVEFFFVLSGFVMALMHGGDFGKPARIPGFAWSRLCRIYPLLWIVLLARMWQFWGQLPYEPQSIVSWFTLVGPVPFDILPVVWTLRLELAFYAMFALGLLPWVGPAILAGWFALVALFLGGVTLVLYLPDWMNTPFFWLFITFSIEFMAGLAAGALFRWRRMAPGPAAALALGAFVLILWRLALDDWGGVMGPNLNRAEYGLGYGALIVGLGNLERSGHLRLGPWAESAGLVSYPLYVAHLAVIDAVAHTIAYFGRPGWMGQDVVFAAMVVCSLLVCTALAFWVDRPLRRWLRGLGRGSERAPGRAKVAGLGQDAVPAYPSGKLER